MDPIAVPSTGRQRIERMLDAAVVAAALATLPITVLLEEGKGSAVLITAEWAVWLVFLVEYVVRLWIAPRRGVQFRRSLPHLAIVAVSFPLLPAVLGLVRVTRLARIFRALRMASIVVRGMEGLRAIFIRRGLIYVAALASFVILTGGGVLAMLEPQTVRGGYFDGVWWAIVTASTVGYGDIAPASPLGRVIAGLLMLAGIGLVSTLSASISAYFIGQAESAEFGELRARTERMERQLEELLTSQRALLGRDEAHRAEKAGR